MCIMGLLTLFLCTVLAVAVTSSEDPATKEQKRTEGDAWGYDYRPGNGLVRSVTLRREHDLENNDESLKIIRRHGRGHHQGRVDYHGHGQYRGHVDHHDHGQYHGHDHNHGHFQGHLHIHGHGHDHGQDQGQAVPRPPDCSSKPCEQICTNNAGGYTCSCNAGYVVSPSDRTKCIVIQVCRNKADIVFLLDSSGSIGTDYYEKQLLFTANLARHFEIGPRDVQIGAVVFGDRATKVFDLKDYDDKASVTEALKRLPYQKAKATFTHQALNLVVDDNMFRRQAGGRDDAPDIVIVLTDGASSRAGDTKTAAARLKATGARVIAVGIGEAISIPELKTIASSDSDVFTVDSFTDLSNFESRIATRTCEGLASRNGR